MKLTDEQRKNYWNIFEELEFKFKNMKTIVQNPMEYTEEIITDMYKGFIKFNHELHQLFNDLISDICKEEEK